MPHERRGVLIVGSDELLDLMNKLRHTPEGTSTDCPLRDDSEPPLHLVQPRGLRRGEVKVESVVAREPPLNLGMLVGGVVVQHDVHLQIRGHALIDVAQEAQELLVFHIQTSLKSKSRLMKTSLKRSFLLHAIAHLHLTREELLKYIPPCPPEQTAFCVTTSMYNSPLAGEV